jgi:hypothetical protein
MPDLSALGNVVPEGYTYLDKVISPGEELSVPGARFKWYDLRPPDLEITPAQVAEARAFVESKARQLQLIGELGFIILHRTPAYLLLLINTWRQTNEIWESAFAKEVANPGGYEPFTFGTIHRATFCVWELTAVWHERNAWVRFLSSKRDDAAKSAYLRDRFSGPT